MAIIGIDLSGIPAGLSEREFLRRCDFSVGDRGRFSKDQQDTLKAAREAGYVFPAAVVKETVPVLITQKELELEPLRQWMIDQGMPVQEKGRIAQTILNDYIEANPDAPRRSMLPDKPAAGIDRKIELKPLPNYNAKAARKWAIDQGLEGVPERGRLPRWIAERFIAANEEAGIETPVTEPDHTNNFGPAAPRVNMADFYEGYEFSYDANGDIVVGERVNNEKGGALAKKSYKDCDVKTGYSIGYVPGYTFAFDPRDSDDELVLLPVR